MIESKEQLIAICEEAQKKLLIELNGSYKESSPPLYHYTNLSSGLEILKGSRLHFTDIRFSNDPTEIVGGLGILKETHAKYFRERNTEDPYYIFADNVFRFLDVTTSLRDNEFISSNEGAKWFISRIKDSDKIPNEKKEKFLTQSSIFVSCLSERNDDLRQWIPYADDGKGIAIGFKEIGETHDICDATIVQVSYAENKDKQKYAEKLYGEIESIFKQCPEELKIDLSIMLIDAFQLDIIACKSPSYKDEQEWRMVLPDAVYGMHKDVNFKYSKELIKPYIEVEFNKDSVIEVVLGPKSDKTVNVHALKLMLQKYGYNNAVVRTSDIDYR